MSPVLQGPAPSSRLGKLLAIGVASVLIVFAYMASAATGDASARDIFVSDSSTPLTGGFSDQAGGSGTQTFTNTGSCGTPNWSIMTAGAPSGPPSRDSIRDALQKAVTPGNSGVQAGDTIFLCNISANSGVNAANAYSPAKAAGGAWSVDLSFLPANVEITEAPGATVTLNANADGAGTGTEYRFFRDANNQGRNYTISEFTFAQGAAADNDVFNGGFILVDNATTKGTLTLANISASGFSILGAGGVVSAENLVVTGMTLGTAKANTTDGTPLYGTGSEANSATGGGGGIFAKGTVTATGLTANNNNVADGGDGNGGAILAVGNVTLTGAASTFQKNRVLDTTAGGGGAIASSGQVIISNASTFGGQSLAANSLGGNVSTAGNGGAIQAAYVVAGPDVSFTRNSAGGAGGAIASAGLQHDGGGDAAVEFAGNSATGGGAIVLVGNFSGAGTLESPRVCDTPSVITNTNFGSGSSGSTTAPGSNVAGALGGGAIHLASSMTDSSATGPENPNTTKKCPVNLAGTDFNGNLAGAGGGGAVYAEGGAVTASATTQFRNNDAGNTGSLTTPTWGGGDGGALNAPSSRETDLTVPATTFSTNEAGGNGGAVSIAGTGTKAFTGSTFTNNAAAKSDSSSNSGGAISSGSAITVSGATFTGNSVASTATPGSDVGGAVALSGGNSSITGSTFTNNNGSTHGSGGAVAISSGSPKVTGATFTTNKAGTTTGNGGAILHTGGTPEIVGTFTGNTATGTSGGFGGAISTTAGLTVAAGNTFSQNAASLSGGAISHATAGNLTVNGATFQQNFAAAGAPGTGGGAISSSNGTLTVDTNARFTGNVSSGDGGAIQGSGTTVLNKVAFTGNRAGADSTGAFVAGGSAADGGAVKAAAYTIGESTFASNRAANNGGAADLAGSGTISSSSFTQNAAGAANAAQSSQGGALSLSGGDHTVASSSLKSNTVAQTNAGAAATTRGGAIAVGGSSNDLALTASTVASNSVSSTASVTAPTAAAAGGGIYIEDGDLAVRNSTLTSNQAPVAAVAWTETAASRSQSFVSSTIASNNAPASSSILRVADDVASPTGGVIAMTNSVIAEAAANGSACTVGTGGGSALTNNGGNVLTTTTDCGGSAFVGTGGGPAAKQTAAQLALGALSNNGGPTETMALGLASTASSTAGANALGGSPTDQRGIARPATNQSSGAYQLVTRNLNVSKSGAGQGTVTSSPAGINCGPTCSSENIPFALTNNAVQLTLTANAAPGSTFQSWSGPCASISGNTCVVNLTETQAGLQSITANFSANPPTTATLTVTRAGNGEGKVTSSPAGINCGNSCEADFGLNSNVTLTAEPQGQSTFLGWTGACTGADATCVVTMDQARTVSANFTQSARARIVATQSGTLRVPGNRRLTLASVDCLNGNCKVVQVTARVKVRGKTYRSQVTVDPNTFAAGESRTVSVTLPNDAFRALRKGKKSGSINLVIRAEAELPGSFSEVNKNLGNGLRR